MDSRFDDSAAFTATEEPMSTITTRDGAESDDDQIVPIGAAALRSAKLVKGATLKVYKGAPHGIATVQAGAFNADLLQFIESGAKHAGAPSEGAPLH